MIDSEHLQAVALAKALALQSAADERRAGQQHGFDERGVFGREIGIGKARVGDDLHAGGIFDLHDVLLTSLHQQDVAFLQRGARARCDALLLVPDDAQHLEPELLSDIRTAERLSRQRGARLNDDLAQVRPHPELFGQPGGRAAVGDEAAREEHVNKPDHSDWNADRRELEHAHGRQAIGS